MKKFLAVLILIFSLQTPSQADDIRDFQIEGMSIGDSALEYFDLEKINNAKEDIYCRKSNKPECANFYSATFWDLPKFEIYDAVRYHAKNKDRKHIIYTINGQIFFPDNFEGCLNKKDIIVRDVHEIVKDLEKRFEGTTKHDADKSGKSFTVATEYYFPNGDSFAVACYNWSKEMGYPHTLHLDFSVKDFTDWLNKIY